MCLEVLEVGKVIELYFNNSIVLRYIADFCLAI